MITSRKPPQITFEALAAWRAGNRWALHRALNLRPWDINPLDAVGERPRISPDAMEACMGRVMGGLLPARAVLSQAQWKAAQELRALLERETRGDAH